MLRLSQLLLICVLPRLQYDERLLISDTGRYSLSMDYMSIVVGVISHVDAGPISSLFFFFVDDAFVT